VSVQPIKASGLEKFLVPMPPSGSTPSTPRIADARIRAPSTALLPREPLVVPTEVHVGFCDIEGGLLKQSDWLKARRSRYFYLHGRALVYYHSQPHMERHDDIAVAAARAGDIVALSPEDSRGDAAEVRLVADRPPDGCFILAAPPFDTGLPEAEFAFAVACLTRAQPLVLFASSAEEKEEWTAALSKTFTAQDRWMGTSGLRIAFQ
jgi:hypothetical protein